MGFGVTEKQEARIAKMVKGGWRVSAVFGGPECQFVEMSAGPKCRRPPGAMPERVEVKGLVFVCECGEVVLCLAGPCECGRMLVRPC